MEGGLVGVLYNIHTYTKLGYIPNYFEIYARDLISENITQCQLLFLVLFLERLGHSKIRFLLRLYSSCIVTAEIVHIG